MAWVGKFGSMEVGSLEVGEFRHSELVSESYDEWTDAETSSA